MSRSASRTPVLTRKENTKLNQGSAGAVDEDYFYEHFARIEAVEVHSTKDLQDTISDITRSLKGNSEEWEKRIKALRLLQSIAISASSNDEFLSSLRLLQVELQSCLTDLRSQVVREACLCVAYLAHVLKVRFEHIVDFMMSQLFALIQNSVKIVSTSGMVALFIIVANIHTPRILLQIISVINSKSSSVRRFADRLLETICSSWNPSILDRQLPAIETALLKGMLDADQDVRSICRRAFVGFALNFPRNAHRMLMTMDSAHRSLLEKELAKHPVSDILVQVAVPTKHSAAPAIKLGTRGAMTPQSVKKNYMLDSGDESSQSHRIHNSSTLHHPRRKGLPSVGSNIMTKSVNRGTDSTRTSKMFTRPANIGTTSNPDNYLSDTDNMYSSQCSEIKSSLGYQPLRPKSERLPKKKYTTSSAKDVVYSGLERRQPYLNNRYSDRRRFDSSDDNVSETSSAESSEMSGSSLRAHNPTKSVVETMRQLSCANWTGRKDGLINLINILQVTQLSQTELKKCVEIINTLFSDSNSKISSLLLVCVQRLIERHHQFLTDWLYTLLVQVISKQATETLASRQKPVQDLLGAIRSQFPLDILIRDCCKIICENCQNSSMKLKLSILAFFKTVLIVSASNTLERSLSNLTLAVNVLIDWACDAKWQEIRKISAVLLVKFDDLHPRLFDTIVDGLSPLARQKINIIKNQASNTGVSGKLPLRSQQQLDPGAGSVMPQNDIDNYIEQNTKDIRALSVAYNRYGNTEVDWAHARHRISNIDTNCTDPIFDNSTEDNSSANKIAPRNSNASFMINRFQMSMHNTDLSSSYGNQDRNDTSNKCGMIKNSIDPVGYTIYDSRAMDNYPVTMSESALSDHVRSALSSSDTENNVRLHSSVQGGLPMLGRMHELPPNEMVVAILSELCHINQRTDQRRACLVKLINIVRNNSFNCWNDYFKTTLMRLLESLRDNDPGIRCLALRTLQELTKNMPNLFDDFTHLTVLKVLQTHMDYDKTVIRAAEECSQVLARYLSQSLCIRVLSEVIKENNFQLMLGGLKMLHEVLKSIPHAELLVCLEDMMPGITMTSEHDESQIRKASIFCLVEIHRAIGDSVWSYLSDLSNSKIRLLRLYIDKNKTTRITTDSSVDVEE